MGDDALGNNEVRPILEVSPVPEDKQRENRTRVALATSIVAVGLPVVDNFLRSHGVSIVSPEIQMGAAILATGGLAIGSKDTLKATGKMIQEGSVMAVNEAKQGFEGLMQMDTESRKAWLEQTKKNLETLDWQTKGMADSIRKIRAGVAEVNRDIASLTPWLLSGLSPEVSLKVVTEKPKEVSSSLRETTTETMKEKTKDKIYVDILVRLVDSVTEELVRTKGRPDFARVETALSDKLVKRFYKGDVAKESVARGWIEQCLKAGESKMPTVEGKVFVGMLKGMKEGIDQGSIHFEQADGAVLNFVVDNLDKVLARTGEEKRREWYLAQLGINPKYPNPFS